MIKGRTCKEFTLQSSSDFSTLMVLLLPCSAMVAWVPYLKQEAVETSYDITGTG